MSCTPEQFAQRDRTAQRKCLHELYDSNIDDPATSKALKRKVEYIECLHSVQLNQRDGQ